MTGLKVSVEGDRETRLVIEGFGRRAARSRAALDVVSRHLEAEHRTAFATAGANLPKPWAPLAGSTRARKRREGWPLTTLVRRGDLRDSLAGRSIYSIRRPISAGLEFGTRAPAARLVSLARNGGRMPVQIPRRHERIIAILQRHIAGE